MARFDYDDKLSFIFPNSIEVEEEVNEEGKKSYSLNVGLYLDDDGEIQSRTKMGFMTISITSLDAETRTTESVCEDIARGTEGARYYVVPEKPECMFMNIPASVSILGNTLNLSRFIFAVRVSIDTLTAVSVVIELNEDNPERVHQFYKDVLEIARSVRVSGDPIPLGDLTSEQLQEAIQLSFDEDNEAVDITSSIRVEVTRGDETFSFSFGEDDLEEEENDTSSGWGQSITIEGDETPSFSFGEDDLEEEVIDTSSGWGQNITIEGDETGLETEDYSSGTAWGSGMMIDGKPVK